MAVYWLRADDTDLVKVGYAKDVSARMRTLWTGSPHTFTVLRTELGNRFLEAALHRHYWPKHHKGEWFKLNAADVAVDLSAFAAKGSENGFAASKNTTRVKREDAAKCEARHPNSWLIKSEQNVADSNRQYIERLVAPYGATADDWFAAIEMPTAERRA